jgi:Zn-dependent metalloprotease
MMRTEAGLTFSHLGSLTVVCGVLSLAIPALATPPDQAHLKRNGMITAAQPAGRPAPELVPLWAAFAGQASGPVSVTWSHLWGTPKAIYGTLSDPMPVSEASARQFLTAHALLLKLDATLAGFTLVGERVTPMGHVFAFEQDSQGVPVHGAEVKVHFNRDGRVVGLTNTSIPPIEASLPSPTLRSEQAVEKARGQVPPAAAVEPDGDEIPSPSAKLVIYAETGTPVLAWDVTLPTQGPTWQVFVHAHTGKVMAPARDLNRYATGIGQVFLVNAIVATRDNSLRDKRDAASAVPSSAYRSVTLLGLTGTGYLDGTYVSSKATKRRAFSSTHTFVFNRSTNEFSETMGYYFLDYAQRYIQSLGFPTVNNRQQVFRVDRYTKDNSYYAPSNKTITYGTGGVDDAEDAEVMWHEYGHSIQDDQVPGFGSSLEAGAMGEGFGDYWAGSLGAQFSGGFQDNCIAEWDATSFSSTTPPCLRRLDSAKHYPGAIVGEVHDDGEIWSATLWQIRAALTLSADASKADRLILQHHFLLTTDASFNQAANALITAAINLLYSPTEVNTIRTILQNRGFTVTI